MKTNFKIICEKWKFNKDYGVWVSNEGHFKDRYERIIPVRINEKGYVFIKTEQGYRAAHRLVMLTWMPCPDAENLTVDHLDHNKRHNAVSNLEWVSEKVNKERAKQDLIYEDEIAQNEIKIFSNESAIYINDILFPCNDAINFLSKIKGAPGNNTMKKAFYRAFKDGTAEFMGFTLRRV